jgi:hypothetical protein
MCGGPTNLKPKEIMTETTLSQAISIRLMPDTLKIIAGSVVLGRLNRSEAIEHLIHQGLIAIGTVGKAHKFLPRPGMGPKPGHKFTERTLLAEKKKLAKSKS